MNLDTDNGRFVTELVTECERARIAVVAAMELIPVGVSLYDCAHLMRNILSIQNAISRLEKTAQNLRDKLDSRD